MSGRNVRALPININMEVAAGGFNQRGWQFATFLKSSIFRVTRHKFRTFAVADFSFAIKVELFTRPP
jgi:hypothetical protein